MWMYIILIVVYFMFFYYLFIVRRKKENKKREEVLSALAPGKRILTISGLNAEVLEVRDGYIIADISGDPSRVIRAKLHKGTVQRIL